MEGVLIQRAVRTTIHTLYDKSLFDIYYNADEVLRDCAFVERRRPNLGECKGCHSMILFINII